MKLWLAALAVVAAGVGCGSPYPPPLPAQVPGTVTGTVVIAPCRPVERPGDPPCPPRPGIKVHFDRGSEWHGVVLTDATGTYQEALAPGTYQVWAEGGIVRPAGVTVIVASGQTVTLNLTVDSGIR